MLLNCSRGEESSRRLTPNSKIRLIHLDLRVQCPCPGCHGRLHRVLEIHFDLLRLEATCGYPWAALASGVPVYYRCLVCRFLVKVLAVSRVFLSILWPCRVILKSVLCCLGTTASRPHAVISGFDFWPLILWAMRKFRTVVKPFQFDFDWDTLLIFRMINVPIVGSY
jgi:hypothetical protein